MYIPQRWMYSLSCLWIGAFSVIHAKRNRRVRNRATSTTYQLTGIREHPQIRIPYENHPYEQVDRHLTQEGDQVHRSLGSSTFQPLRMTFHTDAMEQQRTTATSTKLDFFQTIILPRTAEFWSQTLSVIPVSTNLLLQKGELESGTYCVDDLIVVPPKHMTQGIPNTDLVLYVSASDATEHCGGDTLASAATCNYDQFDRPTAGAINFCLDAVPLSMDGSISETVLRQTLDTAIHEVGHILGMSSDSFRYFYDSDTGLPRTARPFQSSTVTCPNGSTQTLVHPEETIQFIKPKSHTYAVIVTPKVRTVARNQLDCQTLPGAPLENQPTSESCFGDHWDERFFYNEMLSGISAPTGEILSPLTLALLEDSGWYTANYTNSRVSPWGHGVGCEFWTEPCLVIDDTGSTVVPDYGQGYFCTDERERGCAPDNSHKMACTTFDYDAYYGYDDTYYSYDDTYYGDDETYYGNDNAYYGNNDKNIPEYFQYFLNEPSKGGPLEADYCPLYESTYAGLEVGQLDCRDSNNSDSINLYNENYGKDSMCFETTSGEGRCYKAKCILNEFVLKVNVRGEWLTCEEDFQRIPIKVAGELLSSTLTCPRLSSACPDMFCTSNCAGQGICNFQAEVNGILRPKCECFDKNDTSSGCTGSLPIPPLTFPPTIAPISPPILNKSFTIVSSLSNDKDQWCMVPANNYLHSGTKLVIGTCKKHWGTFQWMYDFEGKIKNVEDPSFCIHMQGKGMMIHTCVDGSRNQLWRYSMNHRLFAKNGRKGAVVRDTVALEKAAVKNQVYNAEDVTDAETWNLLYVHGGIVTSPLSTTFRIVSNLTTNNKKWCMYPANNAIATIGTKLALFTCKKWKSFQWTIDNQGQIKNGMDPTKCIMRAGKRIEINTCTNNLNSQRWAYNILDKKLSFLINGQVQMTLVKSEASSNGQVKALPSVVPGPSYQTWELEEI